MLTAITRAMELMSSLIIAPEPTLIPTTITAINILLTAMVTVITHLTTAADLILLGGTRPHITTTIITTATTATSVINFFFATIVLIEFRI